MSNILDGIAKSEIVIVDITGNNPNVFYELGIAHSLRTRQTIIIITQDEDVSRSPFDIRHWSILRYDIKNYWCPLKFFACNKIRLNPSLGIQPFLLPLFSPLAFGRIVDGV